MGSDVGSGAGSVAGGSGSRVAVGAVVEVGVGLHERPPTVVVVSSRKSKNRIEPALALELTVCRKARARDRERGGSC